MYQWIDMVSFGAPPTIPRQRQFTWLIPPAAIGPAAMVRSSEAGKTR